MNGNNNKCSSKHTCKNYLKEKKKTMFFCSPVNLLKKKLWQISMNEITGKKTLCSVIAFSSPSRTGIQYIQLYILNITYMAVYFMIFTRPKKLSAALPKKVHFISPP